MLKLDAIDRKIIDSLFFNARMPLTSLAKKLRISKQVAKYRTDKLMKEEIIQGFYAEINPSKIGLLIYMVYLKFQHLAPAKQKQFIEHISKQKEVGLNVSLNGEWEHCIGIWAESVIHFKKLYDEMMKDYESHVEEKKLMIGMEFRYLKPRPVTQIEDAHDWVIKAGFDKKPLDETDKAVLSKLAGHGRAELTEIAKGVNMTPNAIRRRINNLEKKGIIAGYRAIINYTKLGFFHYRIFLHLENVNRSRINSLMEFLKHQKHVISMSSTVGFCDLEFRALITHIDEFFRLMENIKSNFPEMIKSYNSILYHEFYKSLNYIPFH